MVNEAGTQEKNHIKVVNLFPAVIIQPVQARAETDPEITCKEPAYNGREYEHHVGW